MMRTLLSVTFACFGLALGTATAAPIIPTGGDSFLLAYGDGGPPVFEFRSTFGPLGGHTPLPFNIPAGGSSVSFTSGSLTSSAAFAHTASAAGITIGGSTFADAPNGGNVVGQGAPDSDGIISTEFGFGYSIQFTQTADGFVRIDVAGATDTTGAGGYADFGVLLLDPAANELYRFGGPGVNGTDSALVFLPAGVYYFYAQSQSAALGADPSSGNAAFSASLTALAEVPEPISLVVFGGLIVGGGLVARKRLAKRIAEV